MRQQFTLSVPGWAQLIPMYTRRTLLSALCSTTVAAYSAKASAVSDSYAERVLAKRPVAYWKLDEVSGRNAADASGHGHDGIYRGGVSFGQPGPELAQTGAAIGLNGLDAYVEVPDSEVFSQAASGRGLSVEAWFRPDQLDFIGQTSEHYVHWLGKGQAGQFEWGFRFYGRDSSRPNRVSAYIWNASSERGVRNEGAGAYFQDEVVAAAWVHVVACFDPGDAGSPFAGVSIYKNGVLRQGPLTSRGARYATYHIFPRHGDAPLRLGTRDRGSFLAGGLSDVAIYPRVLRPGEILENFAGA